MTISEIRQLKNKRKITMLTAYDFPTASILDKAGIDIILIGDSMANVVLGMEKTTDITLDEMLVHSAAVCRGAKTSLVISDMPYCAYQSCPEKAPENARRFMDIPGCSGVKLEWFDRCPELTQRLVKEGIPVMGHIGLTPQTAADLGGFKVQGKDAQAAVRLIKQAVELERAGCFSLVVECVPGKIAAKIASSLDIPVIGIGAGNSCDGQVLVLHDMIGFNTRFTPKFVKKYSDTISLIDSAVRQFQKEVISGEFPAEEHTFHISQEEFRKIEGQNEK